MREQVDDTEFWRQLRNFTRSAWRLELQPAYQVDYEDHQFAAFRSGRPVPPTDSPDLADWFRRAAEHVAAGRTMGRVRVVDHPATDYQRWLRWVDWWNIQAGETIQYLPRALAYRGGLLPAADGADWWLLDDVRLVVTYYDSVGRRTGVELVQDDPMVQQAREWRAVAIALARSVES